MTFTKYFSVEKKTKINPRFESVDQNLVIVLNVDVKEKERVLNVFNKQHSSQVS